MRKFILLLLVAAGLRAQTTTVTVSSTPIITDMPRFGMNLYSGGPYDAAQTNKNLIYYLNSQFEPQQYNFLVQCEFVSGNNCTNGNGDAWPSGLFNGGTYEMIYGATAGQSGIITATSTTGSATTYTLSATTPSNNDWMIVHQTVNTVAATRANSVAGWYTATSSGCTFSGETSDIASTSQGIQALSIAATSGNCTLQSSFDNGVAGVSFAPFNGTFQLSFRAKLIASGSSPTFTAQVGRSGIGNYLNQSVTLTSSWATYTYTFTASESASTSGAAYVQFLVNDESLYLDDVVLTQTGTSFSNTTVFRDSTVSTLQTLNPGMLRDWSYYSGLGTTLANETSPTGARQSANYLAGYTTEPEGVNYSFGEFLQLCKLLGVTDPWIIIPMTWDAIQITNFMAWLGAPAGTSATPTGTMSANSNSMTVSSASGISAGMLISAPGIPWGTTVTGVSGTAVTLSNNANFALSGAAVTFLTWGGARAFVYGETAPWTSVFNTIHLEMGNENWNGCDGGHLCPSPAPSYPFVAYPTYANSLIGTAKFSPYYSSSKFQFIGTAQTTVGTGAPEGTDTLSASMTNADALSLGPYWSYNIASGIPSGSNCLSSTTCLFEQGDAEVENNSIGNGYAPYTTMKQQVALSTLPIVVYEENDSTNAGNATQSVINEYVPSAGMGIMAANQLLLQASKLGIRWQNVFDLPSYSQPYNGWTVPIFGVAPRMGSQTNWPRPQYLAEEIANTCIGTGNSLITTTQSGANPKWSQTIDIGGSPLGSLTSHYIQSYALSNGCVILINVDPTSSHTVQLAGSPLPSGSVIEYQLTSANITDNNESSNTVQIATTNLSNFNPSSNITLPPFSMTAFVPTGSGCTVTNPAPSTIIQYPQSIQLTLSCSNTPNAYKAIWYIDYQRWAVGFNADQHQAIVDWAEQWQGVPFAVQWQPGLSGDGQHSAYAVVQDIYGNTLATTPAVTFLTNIQGIGTHVCVTALPPTSSQPSAPCPSTPISSASGQGWTQVLLGDSHYYLGSGNILIDGEPLSAGYFGHYNTCGVYGSQNASPYFQIVEGYFGASYPGLASWCWPNGQRLVVGEYQGQAGGDPVVVGIPLPTSGSPSNNTIYFSPGNYPAGHWFANGAPGAFAGNPPAPLKTGGIWFGPTSGTGWNPGTNSVSIAFSGQTVTLTTSTNPISSGATVGANVFVRGISYTDQSTGLNACDGQFAITAVTSTTIQFTEPPSCPGASVNTGLGYPNLEVYVNPYCIIYVDANDIQLSTTFTPLSNAPAGSFQCGPPVAITGAYSSTTTTLYSRMRSPYWSTSIGANENTYGNDYMLGSPPASVTQLVNFSNGNAGMEIQPQYWEFHGFAGKSGDTLCPSGSLNILNTDLSTTAEPCTGYTFTFAQDGGVTGAISFNSATGAITYNPTSSWSDPAHQTAWAHVTISGSFCGPSHNAACPALTVNIENHGASIIFPHWSTCGVVAQAFNTGLPSNCYSFFPRSEWNGQNSPWQVTWPWKLWQDSNVNSMALYAFGGGFTTGLTSYSSTSCPTWPDSYFSSLSSFLQQHGLYAEMDAYYGLVSPQGVNFGQGATLILNNIGFNRQSCLQSLIQWMSTAPNNRFWSIGFDDENPNDTGTNVVPNPSPSIANASSPMAAYLPSITSMGVSGGVLTATVTNIGGLAGAWSQSSGTGNAFQLTGLTTNSACNGWYLISSISGSGPYTIAAPVPSYMGGCTAASITDSGGVMVLPSYVPGVPANASIIPANPGQGCSFIGGIDCQALSSSIYITLSGSTATVTWQSHKLSTGQVVRIWGATTANLNNVAPITVTGTNTFTFVYPGGTGGATPTCTGTSGQCNGTTDPNAYITVDPGYGPSMMNSLFSVIANASSNAPAHCFALNGGSYGAGASVVYNWMANPANVSCGGLLYVPVLPTNYTQPDVTNVQMSQYSYGSSGFAYRPFERYPRSILLSENYLPFVTQYCRSFSFNPGCDKPSSGANDLNWSPELAVTQFMSAKVVGIAGFRHYKAAPGWQSTDYANMCCGWGWGGSAGYGGHFDANTAPRPWNGIAHTYALLHAREDTELQPESNKPYLSPYHLTDAHLSSAYGNETTVTCVSSNLFGQLPLQLNPISGGSLILYLLDGYTLRAYTSSQFSWLAGNPSAVTQDWCKSPITGQQSPGLTWIFVSLPANYSPLDAMTFTPPSTLPFGASKFLIQVGYYPEDMRSDPVTDCTSTCTIGIDHHNLNAWYRIIYADGNSMPKSIGQPVELASQGLY